MFVFDQIAVRSINIDNDVSFLQGQGHSDWVRDRVHAVHLYGAPAFNLGEEFEVSLAFNYDVFRGQEFEIIQLHSGRTAQLREHVSGPGGISHFGYHIENQGEPEAEDSLTRELRRLRNDHKLDVVQVSQTISHTGTKTRYRYAFAFFAPIGAPIKIIQRLNASSPRSTVEAGKEMFQWLASK